MLLEYFSMGKQYPNTLLHFARRSDHLAACVCVASSHHTPCVPALCLCVAWPASAFLALWPSCSACVRACCSALESPYLPLTFEGCAVTEVLHDLRCGLALSPVRHDLPPPQKKEKGQVHIGWGRLTWQVEGVLTCFTCLMS